jgi:hypothetical protein
MTGALEGLAADLRERALDLIGRLERRAAHERRCAEVTDNPDARVWFLGGAKIADEDAATIRALIAKEAGNA